MAASDKIVIRDLHVKGVIGVEDHHHGGRIGGDPGAGDRAVGPAVRVRRDE